MLFILFLSVYFEYGYETKSDRAILLHLFTALLFLKSVEIFIGIVVLCMQTRVPLVSFSPVEALAVLFVERAYTSKIWYLTLSLPSFAYLIVMLIFGLCSYVVLGFLIFNPNSEESIQYFNTFFNGLWNMFMVFTASNWPNPMMPAYNQSRFFFLYFFVFILIFHWGLLNILLGFVYTLFSQQKDRIQAKLDSIKNQNIRLAFHILDTGNKGYLTYGEIITMLEIFYDKYEHGNMRPTYSELNSLVLQLNKSNGWDEDFVRLENFMQVLEECSSRALRIYRSKTHLDRVFSQSLSLSIFRSLSYTSKLSRAGNMESIDRGSDTNTRKYSSEIPYVERYTGRSRFPINNHSTEAKSTDVVATPSYPQAYDPNRKSTFRMELLWTSPDTLSFVKNLSLACDTVYYDVFVDTIIIVLGSVYITVSYRTNSLLITIVVLEVLECMSKLLVKGWYRYKKSYRNYFDGTNTLCMIIAIIVGFSFCPDLDTDDDRTHSARYFYSVQVLILIRVLAYFPRTLLLWKPFKKFRRSLRDALESALVKAGHFYFLLLVMLVFMYSVAAIGVHSFGGRISFKEPTTSQLASTPYASGGYYPLNFNDIPSGMATLYVLLHVNNMHVIASGFTATTSDWAELFFSFWYILGVLFLLNILVAFFLNEFITSLQDSTDMNGNMSSPSGEPSKYRAVIANRSLSMDQESHIAMVNPVLKTSNLINMDHSSESHDKVLLSPNPQPQEIVVSQTRLTTHSFRNMPQSSLHNNIHTSKRESDDSDSLAASLFTDSSNRRILQEKIEKIYLGSKYGSGGPRLDPIFFSKVGEKRDSVKISDGDDAIMNASPINVTDTHTFVPFQDETVARSLGSSDSILENKENSQQTTDDVIKPYEKAAVYLQLAINGYDVNIHWNKLALRTFRYYSKYFMLIRFVVFFLAFMRYFERPNWTYGNSDWDDGAIYPSSRISYLSTDASIIVNSLCLIIILLYLMMEIIFLDTSTSFSPSSSFYFWRRFIPHNVPLCVETLLRYLFIIYSVVQIFLNIIYLGGGGNLNPSVLIGISSLNEVYLLWFHRRSLDKVVVFLKLSPRIVIVLASLLIVILFFSIFGKPPHVLVILSIEFED